MPTAQNRTDSDALAPWLAGRSFADWRGEFDAEGYVIFENAMPASETARVRAALTPHLTYSGRNNFEGYKSNRVYSLIAKAPEVFSDMATHPVVLAFVEADLGATALLSAMLAINLHPGETVQPWHNDDGDIRIPFPRPNYAVSAFWAIDDTTEENGATEIIPRSHLWSYEQARAMSDPNSFTPNYIPDGDPAPRGDAVKICLPAGALMLTKGTLFHRGGANISDKPRLIVTPQYCAGWARQLENMMATTPREVAAKLPKRTRELLGYSLHGAFMGYCDGRHPDKLLGL